MGDWKHSVHTKAYIGEGYLHDQNEGKGLKTLSFVARVRSAAATKCAWRGRPVRGAPPPSRSWSPAPTAISRSGSIRAGRLRSRGVSPRSAIHLRDQRANFVLISNEGTSGYVVADAVQFLPVEELENPSETLSGPRDDAAVARRRAAVAEVSRLKKELAERKAQGPARPRHLGVKESEKPSDLPVLARGLVHNPTGDPVPRGFLQVTLPAGSPPPSIPAGESGRLELARWIGSADHPLTARVFVNRAWHWMFGRGIVRTTDNFGTTGEMPSHPELLDWLAVRFMEEGWSVKWLVREIAMSEAYQASAPADESPWLAADPDNRLFARATAASSRGRSLAGCDPRRERSSRSVGGGPTIRPAAANDYGYVQDSLRRSVYLPALRNSLPEFLEAFNLADPSRTTGRRDLGTIAPQALLLLNHPFVLDEAEHAAKRILAEASGDAERLELATYRVLGRPPLEGERAVAASLLASRRRGGELEAWSTILQGLFASLDFRYLSNPFRHEPTSCPSDPVLWIRRPRLCGAGRRAASSPLEPPRTGAAGTGQAGDLPFHAGRAQPCRHLRPQTRLIRREGQMADFHDARKIANSGVNQATSQRLMSPKWEFSPHGQCGRQVSSLFPEIARHVDDLCFIHSMHTEGIAHGPATLFLHTGTTNFIRPSMGSWITYGLGTESQNLPGFITIGPSTGNGGARNYGNAFLPPVYQGTPLGAPMPGLQASIRNIGNERLSEAERRRRFEFIQALNEAQRAKRPGDREFEAAIESFELAWRIQSHAPEVTDLTKESQATLDLYGIRDGAPTADFGAEMPPRAALVRVRGALRAGHLRRQHRNPAWDQHSNLPKHADHARAVDLPVAGSSRTSSSGGSSTTPSSGSAGSSAARPMPEQRDRRATIRRASPPG